MGAQGSVERDETRLAYPYDREVKIVVAGCSWTTMPDIIINKFLGYGRRTLLTIIDEKRVSLQIWDIPIHVEYRPPDSFYFKGRRDRGRHVGFMLLYDVRDQTSFEAAKAKAITPHYGKVDPEMPIMLAGCHCQQKERREVSYYTAREFADERGFSVVEVCWKEGVNVELAFMALVGELLSRNRFIDLETDY